MYRKEKRGTDYDILLLLINREKLLQKNNFVLLQKFT